MSQYSLEVPDGQERGIRVTCDEHGESQEFQPGYRTVAFECGMCGYEIELTVHDLQDWRELSEMC